MFNRDCSARFPAGDWQRRWRSKLFKARPVIAANTAIFFNNSQTVPYLDSMFRLFTEGLRYDTPPQSLKYCCFYQANWMSRSSKLLKNVKLGGYSSLCNVNKRFAAYILNFWIVKISYSNWIFGTVWVWNILKW